MNRESLEELLLASRTGELSEDDCMRLNAMLRDDSESRAFAAQFLATDALLADALETSSVEHRVMLQSRRRNWIRWSVAAIAASVMLALATARMLKEKDGPVAVLAGEELMTGSVLTIAEGDSKVVFDSGALLAVEAPAKLEILGRNAARLHYGVATVRVPGPIKGFQLDTPAEKVVDLGTSFGVNVERSGNTMVTVFEGEVVLGERTVRQRIVAGKAVRLQLGSGNPRESISYDTTPFLQTWKSSFGIDGLQGDVRFAKPGERESPSKVIDRDSLLLIPEREGVWLPADLALNISEAGTYNVGFFRNEPLSRNGSPVPSETPLPKRTRVDSYLLQYNPGLPSPTSKDWPFMTEVQFDREVIGIVAQKDLLAEYDSLVALPVADFSEQRNRGLGWDDELTLSEDRRTIRVAFDIEDGVDQIRVLVASQLSRASDQTASK
jgi:hypothetical protein